ncbi:class I mannose-6-phosphate isomerase [Leifsonia sp. 22587]|uniref:class I mannose-6-phosphate isomerase n=1 Tax=Leifsonia sp. 22587 TaxID=3453946 RepID=UPI003F83C23E
MTTATPLLLGPNQPLDRPYRGGAGIARFRGTPQPSPFTPEDFVASTTEVFAGGGIGLTVLPDGRTLRDAVADDPVRFLGEDHVARFGARTMLLVKLLDTAERLFVHYHPDDAFAARHLGSPLGKTEAWAVIEAAPDAYAALGFRRAVTPDEVRDWWSGQDADAMLDAMNTVPLAAGDTLLVPAGLAHAIGPGVTLVELQQPTDLSVLLERRMLSEREALLGLDLDTAIDGLVREATPEERISALRQDRGAETLFPADADPFFSAERIRVTGSRELEPSFSVVVVLDGEGTLQPADDRASGAPVPVRRGSTVLTAHGDGPIELSGDLHVIRCRPPR